MNIRIERVEVFGVEMPLVGAFASAKGPKAAQKSAVVRITGTGGAVGVGSVEPILSANQEQAEIRFEKELIGHPTEDFHKLSGRSRIKDLESKYLSAEDVRQKYGE